MGFWSMAQWDQRGKGWGAVLVTKGTQVQGLSASGRSQKSCFLLSFLHGAFSVLLDIFSSPIFPSSYFLALSQYPGQSITFEYKAAGGTGGWRVFLAPGHSACAEVLG